jgi:hypothetical protein
MIRSILYPQLPFKLLLKMLGVGVLGAVIAGVYGMIHDQVTYAVGPEYFTAFKFQQFARADIGLPPQLFVSQIGFLATWWVGLIAGWFMARIAYTRLPTARAFRLCMEGFGIMLCTALVAGLIGFLMGVFHGPNYERSWGSLPTSQISDVPAFVKVGYIHNASYLGGLVGLIIASIRIVRKRKITPPSC